MNSLSRANIAPVLDLCSPGMKLRAWGGAKIARAKARKAFIQRNLIGAGECGCSEAAAAPRNYRLGTK
jgi:hypothetical protein